MRAPAQPSCHIAIQLCPGKKRGCAANTCCHCPPVTCHRSLFQGPRPHITEGSPGFRPWPSLTTRVLATAGQAAAASARGPSGATVKPPSQARQGTAEAFRASRASRGHPAASPPYDIGRGMVPLPRSYTPRCYNQQRTGQVLPQLTVHRSAWCSISEDFRCRAVHACTPFLSRDRQPSRLTEYLCISSACSQPDTWGSPTGL